MTYSRVTRTTMFVAVFAVVAMVMPGLMLGNEHLGAADNAAAVGTGRVLRMGWPDFTGNIRTLNPHTMTMGQEYMLILPCYSNLLQYNETGEVLGDLATKYTVSPDGLTYHFWIVQSATFYDRFRIQDSLPLIGVTVDDVIFSFWLAQNNTQSIMNYYFPELPGTGGRLIQSMTKINNYEMEFHLRARFAPFLSALTGCTIVPKYIWDGKNVGWANFDHATAPCVGSGPYYYAYDNIAQIGTVGRSSNIMNPTWFGTTEYGWQPHVYEYQVVSETEATGISNFIGGATDVLISPTPAQFQENYAGVTKFSSSQGFVLDLCINQLSTADRVTYNIGGSGDYNNQLLLDPVVKYAVKAAMNKTEIVEFSLLGGGSPADSLMPSTSPWYYDYGSSPQDTKLIPDNGDPVAARAALLAAGWHYKTVADGMADLLATSDPTDEYTYFPLCKVGGTEELTFRYSYCDWYDFILDEGQRYLPHANAAGIKLVGGPATSSQMNDMWAAADYDIYLWDWWFSPNSEPSLDVMEVMTSAAIGGSSDVNDHNATFDAWYYESLVSTSFEARAALLDDMQRWAYENSGYWPVAYRDNLYMVHSVSPNYWTNWGDWSKNFVLCPDSAYPWWMYIKLSPMAPDPNPAPKIVSCQPVGGYQGDLTGITVTGTVSDNDMANLVYRWNFGDGTSSAWSASPTVTGHMYPTDGYYDAWFIVKENTGADGFITSERASVKVIDTSNTAPYGLSFNYAPYDPDTGTVVTFTGAASDANPGDSLVYTWDFGDGEIGAGQIVTHQFTGGPSTVVMYVDDGHLGQVPRPSESAPQLIPVSENRYPSVSVPDYPQVARMTTTTFVIGAHDDDSRDVLKYYWIWGDGDVSSTTTKSATHAYKQTGVYTLTVWADDQTGLALHNVSDTGQINVVPPAPIQPLISEFMVDDGSPVAGQTLTFSGTATDANNELLDMTFDFGDGSAPVTVRQTSVGQTITVTHVYTDVTTSAAILTVTDRTTAPVDSEPMILDVLAPPTIDLVAGWNFVSLPVVNHGYMASTLGAIDQVAGWDPASKTYSVWWSMFPEENDFPIVGSTGYWVYANSAMTLSLLKGDVATTPQMRAVNVPAGGGWAIVGFNSLSTAWTASDVVGMFTDGAVDQVAGWDPIGKTYSVWWSMFPEENNFALAPGQAYWVFFTASGELTYTP